MSKHSHPTKIQESRLHQPIVAEINSIAPGDVRDESFWSSASRDTHQRLRKQDEEYRGRHSLQVQANSNNNQDEDFGERHSPMMQMSSDNKKMQQQAQQFNEAPSRQGYSPKDNHPAESSQISSRSKQQTLVTSTQGYPQKDDSPLNQSSCPDLHEQQSSTKISTPQEYPLTDDYHPKTQSTYHLPQQQLLEGATSQYKQSPKGDSSGNLCHLLPSERAHSPSKEKYPQEHNQNSYRSTQKPHPTLAPPPKNNHPQESNQSCYHSPQQPSPAGVPPKNNHLQESNQSSHPSRQQPSPITATSPSTQSTPEGNNVVSSQNPSKQGPTVAPSKSQPSSTKVPINESGPPSSSKEPSATRHSAPPKSKDCENFDGKNVARQNDETPTKSGKESEVEWQKKNIGAPRTQKRRSSRSSCCCII